MAETRATPRKCPNCFKEKLIHYLYIQDWGENDLGQKEYKLNCYVCNFTDYTLWNGHSAGGEWDGTFLHDGPETPK